MEQNDVFTKIGGRKFVLTVVAMAAIILIAVLAPTALSNELILGLLGAVATYSGSNAFLTSLAMKRVAEAVVEPEQIETSAPAVEQANTGASDNEIRLQNIEQRMAQNESNTAELVNFAKEFYPKIITLTQGK